MSTPPTHRRPKVQNHEILVMVKLADLYATLAPDARRRVHEHIGQLLDNLPVIAAVGAPDESDEAPPLPFHRSREAASDEQAA